MKIDINEFEDIFPTKGGRIKPTFTLGKAGYFRMNRYFADENDLLKSISVNIKAIKKEDKIFIAFNFLRNENGAFKINDFKDKKGNIKSKSFSGRSIFSQLSLNYKNFAQKKSIKLNVNVQKFEGVEYFIAELPIE